MNDYLYITAFVGVNNPRFVKEVVGKFPLREGDSMHLDGTNYLIRTVENWVSTYDEILINDEPKKRHIWKYVVHLENEDIIQIISSGNKISNQIVNNNG